MLQVEDMDICKETQAGKNFAAILNNNFVEASHQFVGVAIDVTSTTGHSNESDMEEDDDYIVFSTSTGGTNVDGGRWWRSPFSYIKTEKNERGCSPIRKTIKICRKQQDDTCWWWWEQLNFLEFAKEILFLKQETIKYSGIVFINSFFVLVTMVPSPSAPRKKELSAQW